MVIVELKLLRKHGEPLYIKVKQLSDLSIRNVIKGWHIFQGETLDVTSDGSGRCGVIESDGRGIIGTWRVAER